MRSPLSLLPLVLVTAAACGGGHARPPPPATAAGTPVTLTYLGVAGWALEGGGHVILVDPYFSRPDVDGELTPDEAAIAAHAPRRADAVLVTHSHFDHLLDAPSVARRTGAQLVGSGSSANYARAVGLPDERIVPVKGGEDYAFEGFSVRVVPGLHGALGAKHVFGGDQVVARDVKLPLRPAAFGEGGTFDYLVRVGERQVLFIGSANFIERELEGLRPDVAVVATGMREQIHDYTCRLLRALGRPPVVIANHFDAWRKPLEEPVPDATMADLGRFTDEVHVCSPKTRVIVPAHLRAMTF